MNEFDIKNKGLSGYLLIRKALWFGLSVCIQRYKSYDSTLSQTLATLWSTLKGYQYSYVVNSIALNA
ncbi:hypothetical protein ACYATP_06125 [Lactobacillaceae bacterium Melli_B4]